MRLQHYRRQRTWRLHKNGHKHPLIYMEWEKAEDLGVILEWAHTSLDLYGREWGRGTGGNTRMSAHIPWSIWKGRRQRTWRLYKNEHTHSLIYIGWKEAEDKNEYTHPLIYMGGKEAEDLVVIQEWAHTSPDLYRRKGGRGPGGYTRMSTHIPWYI